MFQKSKDTEQTSRKIAPSVISSDMNLIGNIISDGLIDFDGAIRGNITCHTLLVRQHARIHGEIRADNVQVSGRICGTIHARQVALQDGAEVEGTIMHDHITVEEGATVDGKLKKNKTSGSISKAHENETPEKLLESPQEATPEDDAMDSDTKQETNIMEHIRLISANE